MPIEAAVVAITGTTGFIGSYLVRELPKRGYRLRLLLRRPNSGVRLEAASAVIGDLSRLHSTREAFAGVDAVIHTAGLAHAMSVLPEDDYRTLNTEATVELAKAAYANGVKRFVFLSSVRAQSAPSCAKMLTEDGVPRPTDAYGRSKLAAEVGVSSLKSDWVALRLPLTFGTGVRGNFARLMQLAASSYPLPLGALHARRSLLSMDNLIAALDCVLRAEKAMNGPVLVADPDPLSLPEMVSFMREAIGKPPRLVPVPQPVLAAMFSTFGRREDFERVAGSLVVSTDKIKRIGWNPGVTSREAIRRLMREAYGAAGASLREATD